MDMEHFGGGRSSWVRLGSGGSWKIPVALPFYQLTPSQVHLDGGKAFRMSAGAGTSTKERNPLSSSPSAPQGPLSFPQTREGKERDVCGVLPSPPKNLPPCSWGVPHPPPRIPPVLRE